MIDFSNKAGIERTTIKFLSETTTVRFEDEWYDVVGPDHFWMKWRFLSFGRQIRDLSISLNEKIKALEVGGGHGVLRQQIERESEWKVDLTDLNLAALSLCPAGRGDVFYYDVFERHSGMLGRYDAVFLYDVLEHIEDPKPFLEAVFAHLRHDGYLFINVPALQYFHCAYDDVLGHYRRYNKDRLRKDLAETHAQIIDMRYWGFSMLPILAARAALMRKLPAYKMTQQKIVRRGVQTPSFLFDRIMRSLMRAETALLSRPPLGTSLLCVVIKR